MPANSEAYLPAGCFNGAAQAQCSKDFTEHKFKDVLSESLNILSDLDNCLMFFDVDGHHRVTKTDKPLASLVKQAQELFDKAQELGNVLA